MKKNFILAAGFAMALFITSCDSNNSQTDTTTADATAATEAAPAVDNPNVVSASEAMSSENAPVITFENPEYDFGTIKQGEVIEHVFTFTNTGKSPLIIENASASCGCTVPEPPTEPIAPGETGSINVKFNSAGKMGQQYPTVTVRANTQPNLTKISMKGVVESSGVPNAGPEGPVRQN
ncbi:DUF1573 domain-containing protein [Pontibacter sp. 172403-2]|uniref:DUF1573 domain-containing protein n=1 Tax=Pontibacter rufus TaxID=2791028 RepID=UPI0018AFA6B3|nr:DUF1573 domain-containing protein [Pontibacter sp. 172403-2]MBF9253188.1 DUF1573 domain-containing protein [Pontibacter sp. 172403-2]